MPLTLLIVLTLACWPDQWQPPPEWFANAWYSIGLTWLGVVLMVGWAFYLALRARHRLAYYPEGRNLWLRRYHRWKRYHYASLFVVYGLQLYLFGWAWAVQSLLPGGGEDKPYLTSGGEFFVLAPFLAGLAFSWACFYDAERAFFDTQSQGPNAPQPLGRWGFVLFQARQRLALICVPVTLLIVQKALIHPLSPDDPNMQWKVGLAGFVVAMTVLLALPWILRLVMGLGPFPPGPVRDRLLAVAQRLNFRFSDLLLWDTRGYTANAMVAGLLPIPRYVLLSDRLVFDMNYDEIEAVFGHEVGHVKHRHMLLYLMFMMLSMAVLWTGIMAFLPQDVSTWFQRRQDLEMIPFLLLTCGYFFVFFGFLSRRCERQADLYGCRAVSCGLPDCTGHDINEPLPAKVAVLCPTGIRTFIRALEKVGNSNGISRDKPGWLQSWQHSTIARRVQFLQDVLAKPELERRFQRRVLYVKFALFLGLFAGLAVLIQLQGWDIVQWGLVGN